MQCLLNNKHTAQIPGVLPLTALSSLPPLRLTNSNKYCNKFLCSLFFAVAKGD